MLTIRGVVVRIRIFNYRDKLFGCDGNLKRLSVSREGVGSDYPTE